MASLAAGGGAFFLWPVAFFFGIIVTYRNYVSPCLNFCVAEESWPVLGLVSLTDATTLTVHHITAMGLEE